MTKKEFADALHAAGGCYCRECEHFKKTFPGYGECFYWDYEPGSSPNSVEESGFCSYGRRREGTE